MNEIEPASSDTFENLHRGRGANKAGVDPRLFIVALGCLLIAISGYLIGIGSKSYTWALFFLAPVAVLILIRPFVGLLIMVALIPLESAFLGLSGGALTVTRLLGLYVIATWIIQLVAHRQTLKWPTAAKWLVVFIIWAAASYVWADYQAEMLASLQTAVQLLVLALLVIDHVNSRYRLQLTLMALFVGCALVAALGLLGIGVRTDYPLLSLQNQGAKEFSSYMGIVFLMGTILYTFGTGRWRVLGLGASAVAIIPLISAGERGVILALGLTWMALAVIAQRRIKAISVVMLVLITVYFLPRVMGEAGLLDISIVNRWTVASVIDTGGTGRTDIWKAALATILKSPLIGVGLGNFTLDSYLANAHNDWLSVASETGLVGLLIFLIMLTKTGRRLINAISGEPDTSMYMIELIVLGLFVYSLSIGLTSTYMWRKIYWLILGMAISMPSILDAELLAHPLAPAKHL